jgi:peptide chain release factor 3
MVVPDEPDVSAFVFKIQANMDAHHRDRVAFLRICSGRMSPHMDLRITRTGEPTRIDRPLQFFARERTPLEGAVSGDVIGLWDSGKLRIAIRSAKAYLSRSNASLASRRSTSHACACATRSGTSSCRRVSTSSEEGAAHVFSQPGAARHFAIVGVVGVLQLEVVEYRLKHEYGVDIAFESLAFQCARWAGGDIPRAHWFDRYGGVMRLTDAQHRPVIPLESEWAAHRIERDNASLRLLKAAELDAAPGPSSL